ncbi:mitochondrial import inner membrane translocase subunit Tim10 B isoform X1 [Solenopsis invicta]|uniref:mitochondrial import inner membrane translocase subunit Tim10 B isoform X1 n=1 Tax=Solenopsis invicta TaxID=13686 RepID=UPI000595FF9B|nr:mitochondrial import inner membrane translocase subunit Tim10 B isoform X1 [Solenopsis invicta]XP_011165192.1 mitochondrial import inner membrane translocase subunit Tim10 B isoform X1 [Solenopsis invicta]XP_025997277.1 mitochondrial import inner membrane translocase subunit Tim10 B isoform X1 [Solenopsis invicta]
MDALQLRNFKDFLLLYNQISETCFKTCANTFLSREITSNEDLCVNNCAQKYIHANHKIMEVFMEVQPLMMHKRIEEINTAQTTLEEQNQQIKLEENPQ